MLPWNDAEAWGRLRRGDGCPLCFGEMPGDVVAELPSAYVRVPAQACLAGYVCVIHRWHVAELHELAAEAAAAFVADVCRASAAVQRLTGAVKINLLSLGNLVPHLHIHVCPRRPGDRMEGRALDPGETAEVYARGEHEGFIGRLRRELARDARIR